ncbi:hypothetical protein [Bifidobacterium ruminantium]|uniref:hypothetical protein n=1 Tax=Bifidobacterium ruminantium TaxID=78346 RepID=UPI001C21ADB5|nr:hypothetical protein [Bifidobacterium ruminantium]MBU9112378.1 hypothetical protein [Bifidobacterium ruminantium]
MSAANPNPQYNSPAEQAFVEMGSTAFKDIRPDSNRFQEIDAQYAGKSLVDMVNPDPEKNSNPENKNLFQRILVAAYAQRFVDSVKSMLNTHENSLPRKGNESYEQYACKCLSECGVTWSPEESEQSKDSQLYWDKIQSFIAAYYTSEKVQKQCNKLSRQKAFALCDLYWDRDGKEWKKEDDSRKKRKYYTQAYWAYGWLLVPNNNAARPSSCPREAQLWDICHGIVTEDEINLCVTVGDEESKEFKNLKSASDILSSHADDGTLGDFVREMEQATPGTFGTWAYDTTFVEPDKKQSDAFGQLSTTQRDLDKAAKDNFGELRKKYEGVRGDCANLLIDAYRASEVEHKQWKNGPNPRFLFQFLNWGDSLSAGYPNVGFDVPKSFVSGDGAKSDASTAKTDFDVPKSFVSGDREELFGHLDFLPYVDFSGPTFAAVKKDRTWTPKEEWRESGCDASNSGDEDNIGNFVSATFNTPLWGGFMTDYIKGIHTPDAKKLADSFKRHGLPKDDAKLIYKAMDELTRREVCKLQEFLGRNGSDAKNCKTLLMLTTVAFNHIAAGNYNWARPWQVIRWPHHSGSGAGTFKATTLAYAYGRVERALEYVEQRKPDDEAWPWPFCAYVGYKSEVKLRGSSPSLLEWFKNEFAGDCHEDAVDFTKSGVLHCYKRYSALVEKKNDKGETLLKSKDAIVADAKKALAEHRADDAIDAVKSVMYKGESKPSAEDYDQSFRVEVESSQAFLRLKPSEGRNGKPGKSLEQRQVEFVVNKALHWKDLVAEDDVNAAFLLGWRSEDKLVKDGEWHVPDAFDETLMPAPKDLVSVKKELAEMRKKQG